MKISHGKHALLGLVITVMIVGLFTHLTAGPSSYRGYLGVSIERIPKEDREDYGVTHGVLVTSVEEDSPAEKAGIEEDDVILYFNGEKIRRTDHLVDAVRGTKPRATVKVTIFRDGQRLDLDVEVGRIRSPRVYAYGWSGDSPVWSIIGGGRAQLGVRLHEMNDDLAAYFGTKEDGGALILEVEEDSPAEEAGLLAGDVIVEIDEDEVWDPADVRDILFDFEEGDEVEVVVLRQKRKQRFNVKLDEYGQESRIEIFRTPSKRSQGLLWNGVRTPHVEYTPKVLYEKALRLNVERRIRDQMKSLEQRLKDRECDAVKRLKRIEERVKA